MEKLNYSHLYYFYEIARHGGVTRASRELGLSQPTLSTQLNQLEESLGVLLFDRKGRSLSLNPLGRKVYDYATEIFRLGAELLDVVNDRRIETSVSVQIGVLDAVPKAIIARLSELALANGNANISITEGSLPALMAALREHKLDLVVSNVQSHATPGTSCFHQPVGVLPVVFVGTPQWAQTAQGFPSSLNGVNLIAPILGEWLRTEMDQFFSSHKVFPRLVAEVQDLELQKRLALSGQGVTALARVSVEQELANGTLIELGNRPCSEEAIWLISAYRRHENPVAAMLLEKFRV